MRLTAEFTRAEFSTLVVDASAACGEEVLGMACFKEPHANGEVHNNLLVRARRQYRWKKVPKHLRGLRVRVDFSTSRTATAKNLGAQKGLSLGDCWMRHLGGHGVKKYKKHVMFPLFLRGGLFGGLLLFLKKEEGFLF